MRKALYLTAFICAWVIFSTPAFADKGLVAWWKFDQAKPNTVIDSAGKMEDTIRGNCEYTDGVVGKAARFDGYTTFIKRQAGRAPKLTDTFTIEAWIAPQTYSWNWTGIVDQAGDVMKEKPQVEELKLMPGLFGAKYNEPDFSNPDGTDTLEHVNQDWTGGLSDWSARWRGYIEGPFTGQVTFDAEADNGVKLEIDDKTVIDGWGRKKNRSGGITMVKGRKYPVVLSYYQDGDPSFLRLYWSWQGQPKKPVEASALRHSDKDIDYVKTKELAFKVPPKERDQRLFFAIDSEGHIGMKLMINNQLEQCISDVRIPLLKWSHVVGTFDKNEGIRLYINSKAVGSLAVKGTVMPPMGHDLLIGMSHKKMSPANTERGPSRSLHSNMVFDGLIDEVKIYNRTLTAQQVSQSYASVKPKNDQPLSWRVMPSGPKEIKGGFGAAYCRLRYSNQWESLSRVGDDPDILVVFDESPVRLVFWRGTAYGAVWVTENGKCMGDQSIEATGNSTGWGCAEHMSDKQCRYAHVKLIENNDARVVIHWRYAISDIVYGISRMDDDGWGEWADEYYYIYPDAVSTRKQILHSKVLDHEWQETIVLNQPGTHPEDNIELDALTWGNMDGESRTYSWKGGETDDHKLREATIQITNLKSEYRPFIIFQPNSRLKLMRCCVEKQWSHFPWWNHWPVSQLPNDGRRTGVPDRPAHTSLAQSIEGSPIIKRDEQEGTYTAVSLCGMGNKSADGLVPLARSWNYPAELKLRGDGFTSQGYDRYQRAYVLSCRDKGIPSTVAFEVAASQQSPLVNAAFVIKDWGRRGARLNINGKRVKPGRSFRSGHRHTLSGSDLVVWIEKESTQSITISLSPASN